MKANPKSSPHRKGSGKNRNEKKGIALITVLLVLSLMVVLVIAILSTSMREMRSANITSQSVRSQDLSNTVTSLVVAQLKAATRPPSGAASEGFTWTSQPGLIRNYDANGFSRGYRLYSSSDSIVDSTTDLVDADSAFANFDQEPERFVDLNAPVIRFGSGSVVDSISFPILDPRAELQDEIEGFEVDRTSAPGSNTGDIASGRLLPMPVEWLYMLRDGSIGTLSSSGIYSGSGTPSEDNPMVARFGYWVDDDTCKINVNVASEASPWDIPRSAPEPALDYGERQPAFNELYRYSGHPATTCLSSVFFPGSYPDDGSVKLENQKILEIADLQEIYDITPKVAFGGSEAGRIVAQEPVTLDTDRLFPSIDELVFRVTRDQQEVFSGGVIDLDNLERARGFLTARSRAPEINIHGKPRVACWPIDEDPAIGVYRSGFDSTMAFCSTLKSAGGEMEFIVQREFAENPINELYTVNDQGNAQILKYILDQTYARLPFYGTKLAEKYGGDVGNSSYQIPTNNPTPDDYHAEPFDEVNNDCYRDHTAIALMIVDYIRGVNMHDAEVSQPYADPFRSQGDGEFNAFGQLAGLTMVNPNIEEENPDNLAWHDYGARPILKGMGRHYTISEVALVAFCSEERQLQEAGTPNNRQDDPWANPTKAPTFASASIGGSSDRDQLSRHPVAFMSSAENRWLRYIQVGMLFELSSPMQGFHQIHPKVSVRMVTSAGDDDSVAQANADKDEPGYKGAWGRFDKGEYDNPQYWRRRDNINDTRYTNWTGYRLMDDHTKFENPITYWGTFPENKSSNPLGPLIQSLPEGVSDPEEYKGRLPRGFFGWGGSGGYRILRFPDEYVVDHRNSNELTNGNRTIAPFYAQKPIVLTAATSSLADSGSEENRATMSLLRPTNGAPIQLILYDEQDVNASDDEDIIQVIEVSFETNNERNGSRNITGLPIPNAPYRGRIDGIDEWGGWGRRLTRAGLNESERTFPGNRRRVDVLNDADTVISMIPRHGDIRHIAGRAFVPKELWRLHPLAERSLLENFDDPLLARDFEKEPDSRYGLKAHSLMFSNPYGSSERPPGGTSSERLGLGGALGATFLSDLDEIPELGDYVTDNRSLAKVDYGDDGYEPDMVFNPEEDEDIDGDRNGFLDSEVRERPGMEDIAYDPAITRDFDNGTGAARDGAYANKSDDGADPLRSEEQRFGIVPYFNVDKAETFDYRSRFDKGQVDATFSPNQMIPSPIMFGSLPNMLQANVPWSTLLFRPDLQTKDDEKIHFGRRGVAMDDDFSILNDARDSLLPGSIYAPDHLWLDLFWMPIVDPFPISEPLSTLGKINMNYEMIPFSYIKRATAMHAVLKGERILAIPDEDSTTYKQPGRSSGDHYYKIDAEETLKQFDARFAGGQAFITESEICENFLYPAGPDAPIFDGATTRTDADGQDDTQDNIRVWWDNRKLTGDNSLERPYANIYGRLTTKSNTFTVHMTVQVLRKARSSEPNRWDEDKDRVTSTYRGSSVIERFIDPNRNLPQYLGFSANPNGLERLDNFYEYRIVNTKEFSP